MSHRACPDPTSAGLRAGSTRAGSTVAATATADTVSAAGATTATVTRGPWPKRLPPDARAALTILLVTLLLIPSRLIVGPLGAAGTPASLLGIAGLVWWLAVRMVPSFSVARGLQPVRIAVGVLGASILVSYVLAVIHAMPTDQLNGADRGVLAILSWAGVALVAADLLTTTESVDRVLRRLVGLGGAVAAIGMLQFATGIDIGGWFRIPGLTPNANLGFIDTHSVVRRVSGTASHPIEFGMVLVLIFPFAVYVAAHTGIRRWVWWVIVLLLVATIPMSLSRSAILGLITEILVLLPAWPPTRRAKLALGAPPFIVAMRLAIPGLVGTVTSMFATAGTDNSVQGRTDDYAVVGSFISRSPWFGRGFGTFLPKDFFFLDNQYLGTLIELGFVGLVAVLLLFTIGMALGRGIRARATGAAGRELGQCFVAAFAAGAVGFGTFDGLGFPMFTGVLFLLLGVAGARWRLAREALASPTAPVLALSSDTSRSTSPLAPTGSAVSP
jgi:hypothetical protein